VHQQARVQVWHQACGPPNEQDFHFLSACEGQLGTQDNRCKVCPASVIRSTLGRPAIPLRSGSNSTSATSNWSTETNHIWPNTALTWATVTNSRTLPFCSPSPGTLTRWSGSQLRLSYILRTLIGRMAFT
jgi:hypothetical protein